MIMNILTDISKEKRKKVSPIDSGVKKATKFFHIFKKRKFSYEVYLINKQKIKIMKHKGIIKPKLHKKTSYYLSNLTNK